jgi:hypothetical protein
VKKDVYELNNIIHSNIQSEAVTYSPSALLWKQMRRLIIKHVRNMRFLYGNRYGNRNRNKNGKSNRNRKVNRNGNTNGNRNRKVTRTERVTGTEK